MPASREAAGFRPGITSFLQPEKGIHHKQARRQISRGRRINRPAGSTKGLLGSLGAGMAGERPVRRGLPHAQPGRARARRCPPRRHRTRKWSDWFPGGVHIRERGLNRRLHEGRVRRGESHHGRARSPPGTRREVEHLRSLLEEGPLLFRRKFHHRPTLLRVTKRREDLPLVPKIRVAHMRGLDGAGKSKCDRAEFLGCHRGPQTTALVIRAPMTPKRSGVGTGERLGILRLAVSPTFIGFVKDFDVWRSRPNLLINRIQSLEGIYPRVEPTHYGSTIAKNTLPIRPSVSPPQTDGDIADLADEKGAT